MKKLENEGPEVEGVPLEEGERDPFGPREME